MLVVMLVWMRVFEREQVLLRVCRHVGECGYGRVCVYVKVHVRVHVKERESERVSKKRL